MHSTRTLRRPKPAQHPCVDLSADPKHNYLLTPPLQSRYLIAAHQMTACPHVIEIGGFQTPITDYLHGQHDSVTVIDPLVTPFAADEFNGSPCTVRHIARRLEDTTLSPQPGSYGLVMLGVDVIADTHEATKSLLDRIVTLINNAQIAVLEHSPYYRIGANQMKYILDRCSCNIVFEIDLDMRHDKSALQHNPTMDKGYLFRRLVVLSPKP